MKKTEFFVLQRVNGKDEAVRVSGYSDGVFNFYKNKFGYWYAVEPQTGLAPISSRHKSNFTRKAAAAEAYSLIEEINKWLSRHGDVAHEHFVELISEVDV